MKKVLSLCMATLMLCTCCTSAFAATINEDDTYAGSFDETVVKYGMETGYTVTIPDSVTLNQEGVGSATISVSNAMLPSNGMLSVTINGESYDAEVWHLTDAIEESNKLTYTIKNAETDAAYAAGAEILQVLAGEIANESKSQVLNFALTGDVTKAGTYNDTLTFAVNPIFEPSLAGTYIVLGVKPSTETAINASDAMLLEVLQELYGPDVNPDALTESEIGRAIYAKYGVSVESVIPARSHILRRVLGITPWFTTTDDGGNVIYTCVFKTSHDYHENEDEINYEIFQVTEAEYDASYEYLMQTYGQVLTFSIHQSPDISNEIKNAFLATHDKFSNDAREYAWINLQHTNHGITNQTYIDTWESILATSAAPKAPGDDEIIIIDGQVYVTNGVETVPLYFKGKIVYATDVIQPNREFHENKESTYYGNEYEYIFPSDA